MTDHINHRREGAARPTAAADGAVPAGAPERREEAQTGALRIGLIIGQLTAGGAEGQLLELARRLPAAYAPFVYCLSECVEPIGPEIEALGVPVRVIGGPHHTRPRRLARVLAADNIAIAHAWLYIANSYAWLASMGGTDVALITSARNCKRQGPLHWVANACAFRASRRIVANSQQVARYIERVYRAPQDYVTVIRNGVDTERFCPPPGGPPEVPLVVGIGRVVRQKNPHLFLDAAARLSACHPTVRFAFVGEGPLRRQMQAAVRTRGLDQRIRLPGESRDIPAVLREATLFWLTSRWEGLPNAVLEAMASGVPVVATDVGGTRELVQSGVNGYLIAPGDADALVHYSQRLLADRAAAEACGAHARARALSFSTARMVTAMARLYDEVAAGGRLSRGRPGPER